SRLWIPSDKVGCATPQLSAARPKCCSRDRAIMNSSFSSMAVPLNRLLQSLESKPRFHCCKAAEPKKFPQQFDGSNCCMQSLNDFGTQSFDLINLFELTATPEIFVALAQRPKWH